MDKNLGDFTGFTPRAQKVISILAQQEARRLFTEQVTPEHLFLGILRELDGAGVRALLYLGLDLDDIKRELEMVLRSKSTNTLTLGGIPLSNRFKTVVELAKEESRVIGHNYVGTEHLLLAIVAEEDPDALVPIIMANRNIDIHFLRQAVIKTVGYGEINPNKTRKKQVKTQFLDKFAKNIVLLAQQGHLDPVIGRTAEISRVIQVLSRRQKNNPLLIGEPGVGKTAIVEGIAQMIVANSVPDKLIDKKILLLDLGLVVAGTKYRGEFEDRMKNIIKEAEESDDTILFVDEIHTILGAGNAEGALDASNMLKPALARGTIRCIGATTFDEYRKRVEKDKALVRRFQPVIVNEPTIEETVEILSRVRTKYEQFHNVTYTDRAVVAAVKLSHRYITDRKLPDKAIDLIDEAGAFCGITVTGKPEELQKIENEISALEDKKNSLVQTQVYEKAASIRDQIRILRNTQEQVKMQWLSANRKDRVVIDQKEIESVLASITNIPMARLSDETNNQRYLGMADDLRKSVRGQDKAIEVLSNAIKKNVVGLRKATRPIASLIFLGPTGVGKTALAKALAKFMFGSEDDLIRVDMSEYMEKFNVSKLVGAPPGYVGFESGGDLTEKIRRKPYSVVLFDEIEKAHPEVFNILLQILDEGRINDSLGNRVDFRNSVIILTSNLGTEHLSNRTNLGFSDRGSDAGKNRDHVNAELKKSFKPEFLNRIDDIVIFDQLSETILPEIVRKMIDELNDSLSLKRLRFALSPEAASYIIRNGFEEKYGARSLQRAISRFVEIPATDRLLSENRDFSSETQPHEIQVTLREDPLAFEIRPALGTDSESGAPETAAPDAKPKNRKRKKPESALF